MPNSQINVLIEATQKGFDQVIKKITDLSNTLNNLNNQAGTNSFKGLDQSLKTLNSSIGSLNTSLNSLALGFAKSEQAGNSFLNRLSMQWNLKSFVGDMEKMIAIQLRWYAVQPLASAAATAMYAPGQAAVEIAKYTLEIDKSRSELLRWGATSGKVTEESKAGIELIINAMRKLTTELPIVYTDLSKIAQAFVGAGVKENIVAQMVPDIGRMKVAFGEIDFEKFAVAITGTFNVFKETMKEAGNEADIFASIMDKLLKAQATGIIRPEQFTTIMQYMSEVGHLSGFTLDQILSLSVAITDVGIKSQSAGRLLASSILTLQSPEKVNMFSKIGIEIDRNISLAKQFDGIIQKLKDKIGSAPVSAGWMGFLDQAFGKEQSKIIAALIDNLDRYKKVLVEIENSKGGLAQASIIASAPVTEQWKVFINILKEAGSRLKSDLIENMRSVVNTLVDVADGLLVAVDSSGLFYDKMDKLGTAGKLTHQAMKGLVGVFTALSAAFTSTTTVMNTVLSAFGGTTEKGTELRLLIELLSAVVVGKLIIALGTLLTGALANLAASFAATTISAGAFGTMLSAIAKRPLLVLTLGIVGLTELFGRLNAELDKINNRDTSFRHWIQSSKSSVLQEGLAERRGRLVAINTRESAIQELTKDSSMFEASKYREERDALAKEKKQLDYETSVIERTLANRAKSSSVNEKKITGAPPPDLGKAKDYSQIELSAIKKTYTNMAAIIQSEEDTILNEYDLAYKKGLMSLEDYTTSKEMMVADSSLRIENVLEKEKDKINETYDKMIANIKKDPKLKGSEASDKIKAVEESRAADIEAVERKIQDIRKKSSKTLNDIDLQNYEKRKQLANQFVNDELQLEKKRLEAVKDAIKVENQIKENLVKDAYDKLKITATAYYDFLILNVNEEARLEKNLLDQTIKEEERALALKIEYKNITSDQVEAERERIRVLREGNEIEKKKIDVQTKSKLASINLTRSNSIEAIFSDASKENGDGLIGMLKGFSAVTDRTLEDLQAKWTNTAKNIQEMWTTTTQAMADTFSNIFVDIMNGQIKTLREYFEAFIKSIMSALFKLAAQEMAVMAMSGLKTVAGALIGFAVGHQGGEILPRYHGGGTVVPVFHGGGLNSDERMIIAQTRERILSREQTVMMDSMYNKVMSQNNKPTNVEVNVINQSSRNVSAEKQDTKFDMEKTIVSVVLKDMGSNGSIYNAVKGVRR